MASASDLKTNDLETYAAREKLQYQSFDLPDGTRTPGNDRSYLNPIIFSESMAGRSLLDVGCYLGYFCIEAMKRGAASATGIDPNRESIRRAQDLAGIHGVKAEYIHSDFETWNSQGRRFDSVVCLNVLHHMFDAVHSLRTIMNLAKERVVLEVAQPTLWDLRKGLFDPFALLARGTSAIVLGPPKKNGHIMNRSFLFTPSAMRMLFNQHTKVFEPIEIMKSPFRGRFIVSARKRRIKNLVVLAGPTSSGKSTFARRLQGDASLRARLNLPVGDLPVVESTRLDSLPADAIENLLVEYDLTLIARADMQTFAREPAYQLLGVPERIHFLTFFAKPGRLDQQMTEKEKQRLLRKAGRSTGQALMDLYAGAEGSSSIIKTIYDDWFGFAAGFNDRTVGHTIVENHWSSYEFSQKEQWQRVYSNLYHHGRAAA
jgi:2-polyprenyl-3-methyl-5-hydroxy-6-metoxy-1,4-benzoquinol methylase